jgi:hypothetical protein
MSHWVGIRSGAWPPGRDHSQQVVDVYYAIARGWRDVGYATWRGQRTAAPAADHCQKIVDIDNSAMIDVSDTTSKNREQGRVTGRRTAGIGHNHVIRGAISGLRIANGKT